MKKFIQNLLFLLIITILSITLCACSSNKETIEETLPEPESAPEYIEEETEVDSNLVGIWKPTKVVEDNTKTVTLKDAYGSEITSDDYIQFNADGTYKMTEGFYNLEADGLEGNYEIQDEMIILKAKDGSESGLVYRDGVVMESIDHYTVTFSKSK